MSTVAPRHRGTAAPRHRGTSSSEASAAVVRAPRLARSSSALSTQWRSRVMDHVEQAWLGFATSHDHRTEVRGERSVIIGYLEDGPNLISIAMNGWDDGHPSWWLNLDAHPDATVRLTDHLPRPVRARRAVGHDRDRLWQRWVAVDPRLDGYASGRATETPVIILDLCDVTA